LPKENVVSTFWLMSLSIAVCMQGRFDWARIVTPDAQRNFANDEKRARRGSDDPGPLGIPCSGLLGESGGLVRFLR